MIQLPAKIDVGQLKSILLQRKNMKPRFMLPISAEQAYDCLLAATMAELEYRHRSFYENDDAKAQLRQMARWLTSGSSKFGMLMCGEYGNGKSILLKAFQQLLNILAIPIPDGHGNYGIQITDAKYVAHLARTDNSAFLQLSQKDMLGIDDPGTESQEVMDFGNVVTPVIDLLTKRHDEQLFTIITTNLTPKQIREHYGDRIAERLNEMVEKIVFTNNSYRSI
jgi:DNA replication protein DnaC